MVNGGGCIPAGTSPGAASGGGASSPADDAPGSGGGCSDAGLCCGAWATSPSGPAPGGLGRESGGGTRGMRPAIAARSADTLMTTSSSSSDRSGPSCSSGAALGSEAHAGAGDGLAAGSAAGQAGLGLPFAAGPLAGDGVPLGGGSGGSVKPATLSCRPVDPLSTVQAGDGRGESSATGASRTAGLPATARPSAEILTVISSSRSRCAARGARGTAGSSHPTEDRRLRGLLMKTSSPSSSRKTSDMAARSSARF